MGEEEDGVSVEGGVVERASQRVKREYLEAIREAVKRKLVKVHGWDLEEDWSDREDWDGFVSEVVWWLFSEKGEGKRRTLVRSAVGLILYGATSVEKIEDIADEKREFRETLAAKGVPEAICDMLFRQYVDPSTKVAVQGKDARKSTRSFKLPSIPEDPQAKVVNAYTRVSSSFRRSLAKRRSLRKAAEEANGGGSTNVDSLGPVAVQYFRLSPALASVCGHEVLTRPEIIQHLWAYIREERLQSPQSNMRIICDEALSNIFERDVVDLKDVSALLRPHVTKVDVRAFLSSKERKAGEES